jgi:hypothetical protein
MLSTVPNVYGIAKRAIFPEITENNIPNESKLIINPIRAE